MQSIGKFTENLAKRLARSTSTAWPVWKESVRADVEFKPLSKAKARQLWFSARKWERETREKGKQGGIIGRSAMSVLYSLTHDFLNFRTGRLDPSVKALASKASVCERTCHTALQKLRSLGLINWLRRCFQSHDTEGRFVLRQGTNAYSLNPTTEWCGFRETVPPEPTPDTLGYPTRVATSIEQAALDLQSGNRSAAYASLLLDGNDPLAIALAGLGRAIGAI